MKSEVGKLNATPSKRLFLSIIADYDLNRSICELVDNGLDVWIRGKRKSNILIKIILDEDQKTICVEDNAGGLPRSEMSYIVGPGQTGLMPSDQTIGIFGVGTKRAVVALAQDIKITTRYKSEKTFQVDFDETWLEDENWELPLYQVTDLAPGATLVELQKLRVQITPETISSLWNHLSATYAKFLVTKGVTITLNGDPVTPQFFDNFSYPPNYEPRRYHGDLPTAEGKIITVQAIAGLGNESSPATGEYGVYFYCNNRLIARAVKTFDVGFMKGYAGVPHPKVSLTKVIISLVGDAQLMPWNSSKSDISFKHEVFQAMRTWLLQVVKDYATLSRTWMGDWPDKVFQYGTGTMVDVPVEDFPKAKKSYLPAMPISRPRFSEKVVQSNHLIAKEKPWVTGLYEGIIAADWISKQNLAQRNRIALIVLDSTLEIAFKEYLVNDSGKYYSDQELSKIFVGRHTVHAEMKKYIQLSVSDWKRISHFTDLRNKLIHQRASSGISDEELENYRDVVERVLTQLYGLSFAR